MLKTDSRSRSAVGRISRDDGEARLRPFNRPPTTRIGRLLVPRLQVALAVIAALGAARRAVAIGLFLVAGARFVAAGTLHQHAAAFAVGNQATLAQRLERLFAPRGRIVGDLAGSLVIGPARPRPVEIAPRPTVDLFPKLLPHH